MTKLSGKTVEQEAPATAVAEKAIMKLTFSAEEIKAYSNSETGGNFLPVGTVLYVVGIDEERGTQKWANVETPFVKLSNGMSIPKLMLLSMVVHDDGIVVNSDVEEMKAIIHTGNKVIDSLKDEVENGQVTFDAKFTVAAQLPKAITQTFAEMKKEDYETFLGSTWDEIEAAAEEVDGVKYFPSLKKNRFGAIGYNKVYSLIFQ